MKNEDLEVIENPDAQSLSIGIISDTHGLLRPDVLEMFEHVDFILHAGDIGDPDIIDTLETVAPIHAVKGNMDYGIWADRLPVTRSLAIGELKLLLVHDTIYMNGDMDVRDYDIVVTGHTHRPVVEERGHILWVNPGSAGYRRNRYPATIAKLVLANGRPTVETIELDD